MGVSQVWESLRERTSFVRGLVTIVRSTITHESSVSPKTYVREMRKSPLL